MKRLLFLTMVTLVAVGCRSRGAACRPACVAAPTCVPAPACGGMVESYSQPGTVITSQPGVIVTPSAATPTIPGPEQYVPATNP